MFRILVSLVLAGIRIAGHKSQTFQAVAHLFVGALIGAAVIEFHDFGSWRDAWLNVYIVIGLSIVEVACALYFHFHKKKTNDL